MTERELERAMEFLEGMELTLSESYRSGALIWTILLGVLSFGLLLFCAISIKRARVLGIIAAVAQPVGLFAAYQSVLSYADLRFASRIYEFLDELEKKNLSSIDMDAEIEAFMTPMIEELIFFVVWMVISVACTVLLGVYMIMLIKIKPSAFGIAGLIMTGIKWVAFAPVNVYSMLMENMTEGGQVLNDIAYRGLTFLPILLAAILAILALVRKKNVLEPAVAAVELPVTEPEDTLAPEAEQAAPEEAPAAQSASEESLAE